MLANLFAYLIPYQKSHQSAVRVQCSLLFFAISFPVIINQNFKLQELQNYRYYYTMKQQDKSQSEATQKQLPCQFYTRKKHPPSKKKVKVNSSHCRGELRLIKSIIQDNDWVEVFKGGDIMWSGLALPVDEHSMATEMFVNRLPAMPHLCHKRTLGYILNKFREYWPEQFWFYPRTYLLPEDTDALQAKLKKGGVFIAKPSAGCQGDGIALIKKLSEIPKIGDQQWIVQPYIDKPLLLNKKKFDFRLYVLISSLDPYICYLNEEGLARFCTEDYQEPCKQNFSNPYIHLTNYSLNKNHPDFVNGQDAFSKGGKRCLKVVWEELVQNGVDVALLRARIEELTQRFLTGIYPFLKYHYRSTFPKMNGKCFHVIGVDVLIDRDLNPWLLESNNNPSFNIQHQAYMGSQTKKQVSPVDQYVKKIVVQDTLYLVRRSLQKQRNMQIGDHYYSWKKVLDVQSEQVKEMNIIQNMLNIFHSYCGIRNKEVLTASQFSKLSLLPGMSSQKITRNDYHLIFIKIMRNRFNQNQMNFEDFIDAMEYLVQQLVGYSQDNKLEVMQGHIDALASHLPQEK